MPSRPRLNGAFDAHDVGGGVCVRTTRKAILVQFADHEKWFPKKVLHQTSEVKKKKDEGAVRVWRWFAEATGL